MTYQYTWAPMLQRALGCSGAVPGKGEEWHKAFGPQIPALMQRAQQLDFRFVAGQRAAPNKNGHTPTTMDCARKLSKDDIGIVTGKAPYSEKVPDLDEGFTLADGKDKERARAIAKVILAHLPNARRSVRSATRCVKRRLAMSMTCSSSPGIWRKGCSSPSFARFSHGTR